MNTLRILEISWLVFGLTLLGLCLYNLSSEGVAASIWPLISAMIAAVLYVVRRKQRIAYEKEQKHGLRDAE